jgi:hypothetical protein
VFGGLDAPFDSGYTKIYSTDSAFAALKADGSIRTWGDLENSWSNLKGEHTSTPTDKGYIEIYSN